MVDTFEFCWFRHDAHKASFWFQRSVGQLCVASRINAEDQVYYQNWWQWQDSWWHPSSETSPTTMDPALIDRGQPAKSMKGLLIRVEWVSKLIWCQSYSDQFGNSQRSLLSPTMSVKNIPPTTENWLRKRFHYSMNNDKSTEDKHETNHINNKCNNMDMNTRAKCTSHFLMLGHMHLVAQVWVSSLVIHVHVRLSLSSPLFASTSICPSPSSPFSSLSCTSSCTLSSTTWSPCKNLRTLREQGE